MGGMFAAIGILAALQERHPTGRGRQVQSGLFENNVLLMAQHMALIAITGKAPPPMSVRTPAWPVYDIFDTADGDQVFVGVVTDTQWKIFLRGVRPARDAGRPGLGDAERTRRGARHA